MSHERAPLLPKPGALVRALQGPAVDSAAGAANTNEPGGAEAGLRGAAARDRFYHEDPELARCNVFQAVHKVYRKVSQYVDIYLSNDVLNDPEIRYNILNPLEQFAMSFDEPSIVYVLLLVRLQFVRDSQSALASRSLNESRAYVCEQLAVHLLRHQASQVKGSSEGLLAMARALVGGFHAFQGATEDVLDRIREKEGYGGRVGALSLAGKNNALELAILGKARFFIASQTTQTTIRAIWDGKITYSSSSFIDILPDRWKDKQIALYDVRKAPLLDHYRLRVPKYRSMIEFGAFCVLFASFLLVIVDRHTRHEHTPVSAISAQEVWFAIYSLGYSLDKLASIAEHGWSVYAQGLTNGLDAASVPIYIAAFALRVHSVVTGDARASDRAYAILSCAACLLFPRLAFTTISNNLLVLSLRAMLVDFLYLVGFVGFVFALSHLSEGRYGVPMISEWLVSIFFGLDSAGIVESPRFDPVLGPILFVSFAALSNTLLTSVLVAILSNTFSSIAADAGAEDMFRKAVQCFEGVKSNSLFDYVPPFNLVALAGLWPLSFCLSPRWFHKVNVFTTRTLSLPILLLIALYERQSTPDALFGEWLAKAKMWLTARLPSVIVDRLILVEGAHYACETVFDYDVDGKEVESDWEGTLGGRDEIEEEALYDEPGEPELAQRASVFLDPIRMKAAQEKTRQWQEGLRDVTPSTASSVLAPSSAAQGSPAPLSRQTSYSSNPEASTIRAPTPGSRPPLPEQPSSPPAAEPYQRPGGPSQPQRPALSDAAPPAFSDSPASLPNDGQTSKSPPATRFAPLPTREGMPAGSRDLRRERLPSNAQRGRRMSSEEGGASKFSIPELSSSAPVKDSPLARLYSHQARNEDFDGLGLPGVGRGGTARRRLSTGPASGHQRSGSDGAALTSSTARRWTVDTSVPPAPQDGPGMAEMMSMIETLVATVGRLEKKLEERNDGAESGSG
ncbi:hypothetical protein JCM10213_008860 [Rhodosporidiobolus nylandii]